MNPVLKAEGLSYQYGEKIVWEHVSLTLSSGEIAFLTGRNGSGKSTLLRCLAGWSPTRSGSIALCGRPFEGKDRKQRANVAFVPDVPVFYDDLTAEEHVRFMLGASRRRDREEYAEWLFDAFGLEEFKNQLPSSFSRGMKQKLGLLIAFTLQPKLLLLDEPYGPLDQHSSITLSDEIVATAKEGAAVVLSCHHTVPHLEPDTVLHLEGA